MVQLNVGIGQYEYRSEDGGGAWSRQWRIVPARDAPIVQGNVDLTRLPQRPKETCWDFVTLLPCGFGVALDHQAKKTKIPASIFLTTDTGRHWRHHDTRPLGIRARSLPVERFESLAMSSSDAIAIAWGDPWLFDFPEAHVICSRDRGESWEYHSLGDSNRFLASGWDGRLLALNDGYYLESRDRGMTWKRSTFQVDWPAQYNKSRVALLRHVVFTSADAGYALVVHWPLGSRGETPPDIGLVSTSDGGVRWQHLRL